MKRPDFQEKTEVKVIDRGHHLYSKRGVVTAINGFDDDMRIVSKPYSPGNYPTKWEVLVMFHDGGRAEEFWDWENQLEQVQKKEDDLVIGKEETP